MLRIKKILVVAAHPDDEILGLGATMHKYAKLGAKIRVVILGEGLTSRSTHRDVNNYKDELDTHRANIYSAGRHIGYEDYRIHDFPDNRFDSLDLLDIVKIVEAEIMSFEPNVVLTHHCNDLNIDHRMTYQAVVTACRPVSEKFPESIITFETPSSTEWQPNCNFKPNLFVCVSKEDIKAKQDAMHEYMYERREYPHPRSSMALESLASVRGIASGVEYAEAFEIIRQIAI